MTGSGCLRLRVRKRNPIHLAGGLIFDVVVGDPLGDIALLQDRDRINVVVKDCQIYRDEVSIPGRSR
jgi:hypothetical protein